MKVLNFYNVKGGSGKSSLSYLAGSYLAMNGKKVLFLDLDPQCSLTSIFTAEPAEKTVYDFLSDSESIDDVITEHSDNVSYIPCSLKVFKIQDRVLQYKFEKAFKKIRNYDFIVIDNSPNYSALTVSSIQATDYLFCPSLLSRFDFDSLVFTIGQSLEIKEELSLNIVLNRVGKNETREERLFKESRFLKDFTFSRFQNQSSIRKFTSMNEALEKPKFLKLRESIQEVLREL